MSLRTPSPSPTPPCNTSWAIWNLSARPACGGSSSPGSEEGGAVGGGPRLHVFDSHAIFMHMLFCCVMHDGPCCHPPTSLLPCPPFRTPQLRRVDAVVISLPLPPCPLEGFSMHDGSATAPPSISAAAASLATTATQAAAPPPSSLPASASGAAGPSGSPALAASSSGGSSVAPRRPVVFLTGRVHPGETPASYVMQVRCAPHLIMGGGGSTRGGRHRPAT